MHWGRFGGSSLVVLLCNIMNMQTSLSLNIIKKQVAWICTALEGRKGKRKLLCKKLGLFTIYWRSGFFMNSFRSWFLIKLYISQHCIFLTLSRSCCNIPSNSVVSSVTLLNCNGTTKTAVTSSPPHTRSLRKVSGSFHSFSTTHTQPSQGISQLSQPLHSHISCVRYQTAFTASPPLTRSLRKVSDSFHSLSTLMLPSQGIRQLSHPLHHPHAALARYQTAFHILSTTHTRDFARYQAAFSSSPPTRSLRKVSDSLHTA
jgi:hypothetical protein